MDNGRIFMVAFMWRINDESDYEVFERYKDANKRYKELLKMEEIHSASLCAVIHSSDYETHPKFQ